MSKKKNIWPSALGSKIEFSPVPDNPVYDKNGFLELDELGCGFGRTYWPEIMKKWGEETEGMNPAEFCAWGRKTMGLPPIEDIQKPNDMYHDRSEDLDPRVSNALNDGPKIMKALEYIQEMLKKFYKIKESDRDVIVSLGHFHVLGLYGRVLERLDPEEYDTDDYGKNWEYSKEYKESLLKLNDSVLAAYITFLEAEREALIKRWNDMAKELKPEKK